VNDDVWPRDAEETPDRVKVTQIVFGPARHNNGCWRRSFQDVANIPTQEARATRDQDSFFRRTVMSIPPCKAGHIAGAIEQTNEFETFSRSLASRLSGRRW